MVTSNNRCLPCWCPPAFSVQLLGTLRGQWRVAARPAISIFPWWYGVGTIALTPASKPGQDGGRFHVPCVFCLLLCRSLSYPDLSCSGASLGHPSFHSLLLKPGMALCPLGLTGVPHRPQNCHSQDGFMSRLGFKGYWLFRTSLSGARRDGAERLTPGAAGGAANAPEIPGHRQVLSGLYTQSSSSVGFVGPVGVSQMPHPRVKARKPRRGSHKLQRHICPNISFISVTLWPAGPGLSQPRGDFLGVLP